MLTRRVMLWTAGAFIGSPAHAATAALTGPLPEPLTRGSQIWNPTARGYVAAEFLMTGQADVLEPVSVVDDVVAARGVRDQAKDPMRRDSYRRTVSQPQALYVTRLIVYRPADPRRFSGSVVLEPLYPFSGGGSIWDAANAQIMARGDAYVAVEDPKTLSGLAEADAGRYGRLAAVHPTQMWGMLRQAGELAKTSGDLLGGAHARRVYMAGYSLTGSAVAIYANFHHEASKLANGTNVFDGYAPLGNPWFMRSLDVPVFRLNTQGEFNVYGAVGNRLAPTAGPRGGYRHYEVAGSGHGGAHATDDVYRIGEAVRPARVLAARRPGSQEPSTRATSCTVGFPAGFRTNDMPAFLPIRQVLANLSDWVERGIAPPTAPDIELGPDGKERFDRLGNCLGGLRLPQIEVPVARYGVGYGDCYGYGYVRDLEAVELKALYGSKASYVTRFLRVAHDLAAKRLIGRDGADQLIAWAQNRKDFT